MYEKDMMETIKTKWFKNHKAKLIHEGNLSILEWKNPNSVCYYIRYVFDNNNLYITGDLGFAIFRLTWKADIHSFNDIGPHYFMEKLEAFSNDKYKFNSETAIERLSEWKEQCLEEYLEELDIDDEELEDIKISEDYINLVSRFDNLILEVKDCSEKDEWVSIIEENEDFIEKYDSDYWEWIYDIGDVIHSRILSYLVGLKMASNQLNIKEC